MTILTEQTETLWHIISPQGVVTHLATSENVLSNAEARTRLEPYGRNRLPQKTPAAWWEIVLRQFMSPLIYILTIAAIVMALIGLGAFCWLMDICNWPEAKVRNCVLLLMVLFEIIHIGNCRSETTSALLLSSFKRPILLGWSVLALFIHLAAMQVPAMEQILRVESVDFVTFLTFLVLALTVLVAMEIHKWWWKIRDI